MTLTEAPIPTMSAMIEHAAPARTVEIDFLYLDLTACSRCVGSDESLRAALDLVRPALAATGVDVALRKTLVASEEQARALRFVSSPTIRVNGRDIAGALQESACADCGDLCGCGEETDCRVWTYEGRAYTEAPVGLNPGRGLQWSRAGRPRGAAVRGCPRQSQALLCGQGGQGAGGRRRGGGVVLLRAGCAGDLLRALGEGDLLRADQRGELRLSVTGGL